LPDAKVGRTISGKKRKLLSLNTCFTGWVASSMSSSNYFGKISVNPISRLLQILTTSSDILIKKF